MYVLRARKKNTKYSRTLRAPAIKSLATIFHPSRKTNGTEQKHRYKVNQFNKFN